MSNDFEPHILQNLLGKIALLIKHDEEVKAEKQRRGENFNVFTVLGFYSEEVKLHSAFIAELLNVEGSHGLKDAFLKSFMQYAGIGDLTIDTSKCKTTVELPIGPKTETTGGRIDIIIESPEASIIVENKIYAGDQENQLLRYFNYAKSKNNKKEFKLIYLTLNGNEPGNYTTGGQVPKDKIICISYREVILNWLNHSVELAARHPLVRETIIQYIAVIKKLTGQNIENEHMDELIKILSASEATIKASFLIGDSTIDRLKRHILLRVKQFQNEIKDEINSGKEFEIEAIDYEDNYDEPESGFTFIIKGWDSYKVKFSFAEKHWGGFYYGILNKVERKIPEELRTKIIEKLPGYERPTNDWWICNKIPSEQIYRDYWQADAFASIAKTDEFKQLMKTAILELLAATENLEM